MWARGLFASKAAKRPAFPQPVFLSDAVSRSAEAAATMDHSDIRGLEPHDRDSSGAASL
jgi:hypothetical protein